MSSQISAPIAPSIAIAPHSTVLTGTLAPNSSKRAEVSANSSSRPAAPTDTKCAATITGTSTAKRRWSAAAIRQSAPSTLTFVTLLTTKPTCTQSRRPPPIRAEARKSRVADRNSAANTRSAVRSRFSGFVRSIGEPR